MFAAVSLSDDDEREAIRVFREAIEVVHLSLDTAAAEAGKDVRHFARQVEAFAVMLRRLGVTHMQELAVNLATAYGMSKRARRSRQLAAVALSQKRMARASMRERGERRAS